MTDQPCNLVTIFTDGSCLSNPGRGGWAAILQWRDSEKEIVGHEADTTNNRMELKATIMGRRAARCAMVIDSGVVQSMFMEEPGAFEVSSAEHVLANL